MKPSQKEKVLSELNQLGRKVLRIALLEPEAREPAIVILTLFLFMVCIMQIAEAEDRDAAVKVVRTNIDRLSNTLHAVLAKEAGG